MAGILGQGYPPSGILGGQQPQMGILGGEPSFASMYPTVGMNTRPLPSASTPWYGEQPGILAKALMGARDLALQANQAMPWGGNDPSAIGIDTRAGTIDPSIIVPFATNVAGMATTGSLAAPPVAGGVGMGIRAYHGSPHDFDRFSMDKIGTGEGAQAYGHGLYFAENPAVAKEYRDAIGGGDVMIGGKPIVYGEDLPHNVASMLKNVYKGDIDRFISEYADTKIPGLLDELKAVKARGVEWVPSGRTYEVNIDASPDEFLDWDKPLSEQPQAVKDALAPIMSKFTKEYDRLQQKYTLYRDGEWFGYSQTGDPWDMQMPQLAGDPAVTKDMAAAGIKGIRYKDAGSRTAEGGTHNYVVFDENTINILKKYGLAGLTGGGAAAMALGGSDDASAAQPTYRTGGGF